MRGRLQEYAAAASLLEYLFQRIEPVDEWVAMRLAFLLLDVYLHMYCGAVSDDAVCSLVFGRAHAVWKERAGDKRALHPTGTAFLPGARARGG